MVTKKIKILRLVVVLGLVIIVGVAAGIYFPARGNAVIRKGELYLRQNITYIDLLDSLNNGTIELKNRNRFDRVARRLKLDEGVHPGHYSIPEGMSYIQLARTLRHGWQTPVRVTFNRVRTLPQLAGRIARQIETDSLTLLQAFTADTMSAHYGYSPETFLAMFIPNTYEMYWTVDPQAFLDRMEKESERFWNEKREQARMQIGLSQDQVITLASIVYEETAKSDEMNRVAGVYINRLKQDMPLQADPTVKFAVGDFSLRRILFRHLEVDSPYNTYKYSGLPPGPICMPSVRAIDSVLNYEDHSYLYFCAREDFSGYHNFARTLSEHNRNAARYQQALHQRGIR